MLKEQHFNNLNLKTAGKETRDEKSNWTILFSQFWLTHGVYAHMLSHFSCVWLFANLWTIAHQAPLSMAFSRHEYWSGLPCSAPGDLPDPGIKPTSPVAPALQGRFFTSEPLGNPYICIYVYTFVFIFFSIKVYYNILNMVPCAI